MEEFKVYALDDDGNRIEPQQPEQEQQVEQEAAPQVEPLQTETVDAQQEKVQQQDIVQEQSEEQANVQVEEEEINKALESNEKDDNWFFSKLKERYEVEVSSAEDLKNVLSNNEKTEIPEEVSKYLDYKKETGRSFQDYQKLQKDWSSVDDTQVLREYLQDTKPHLDKEDIEHILSEQYSYDEELDEEREVRAKKIAYKEALYEARNHFEGLKERYKAPLGSSEVDVPENYKEAFSFYNEYQTQAEQENKLREERATFFDEKTKDLFNDEFKGFEFNVGDKRQVVKISDVKKIAESQKDITNFVSSHLDENGYVKDAANYHRALYAAMNPDALAKFFYEQGKADATGDIVKETKNIDMGVRENKVTEVGGTKFRVVDSGDQFEFKIRKRN